MQKKNLRTQQVKRPTIKKTSTNDESVQIKIGLYFFLTLTTTRNQTGKYLQSLPYQKKKKKFGFIILFYFSIALPFRDKNLWSLIDKNSLGILSKYYQTCLQCIMSRDDHENILENFNKDFYNWLQQTVRGEIL